MNNLAPAHDQKKFRRLYFLRLTTVALIIAIFVVIVHGVLLVPSYTFLQVRIAEQEAERAVFGRLLESSEGVAVEDSLRDLDLKLSLLESLPQQPSFPAAVTTVLEVPRAGIDVTSVAYEPAGQGGEISVRGIATNREALRSYARLLEAAPSIESVDFPISDLAEERNLTFTLTVTLQESL